MGSFSQSLTAVTAGVYAGDSASSGSAPGFTALVDYFFNQASPISPEDPVSGGGGGDTTPPVIAGVAVSPSSTSATVSWDTNEASTGTVNYGATSSYGAAAADSTSATHHSVTLSGLVASKTYHYAITATDASANSAQTSDATFSTTSGSSSSGPILMNFRLGR